VDTLRPLEDRPLVFLCRSGGRSVSAALAATAAGLGPSYNVLDGFDGHTDAAGRRGATGWRAAGLPWRQSCPAGRGPSAPGPGAGSGCPAPRAAGCCAARDVGPESRTPASPTAAVSRTPWRKTDAPATAR